MSKNFAELQEQLAQVKPWAVLAVVATLVLAVYYGFEAKTYWDANTEIQAMNYQMDQISRSLRGGVEASTSGQLASRSHRLGTLQGMFDYPQSDQLLDLVSSTARLNRVTVNSASAGDPGVKYLGRARMVSQPMNLTVKGATEDIYRYLFSLHQAVPVLSVNNINLTVAEEGIGSTADLSVVFYLSPQIVSEEEGED